MAPIMIYGTGHAGAAYAAYLGYTGHEVHLFDTEEFKENLRYAQENGGLNMVQEVEGFGKIKLATTDLKEAIRGVEIILVIAPGYAHKAVARTLAPCLTKEHIVALNPGSVYGAIEFKNELVKLGNTEDVTIAECCSSIFASRREPPGTVRIKGIKARMPVACFPANRIEYVGPKLKAVMKEYEPSPNIIYSGFLDNNAIVHPITAMLNTGRIENQPGKFDFYWDGITPAVGKCMESIDQERVAVTAAMGYKQERMLELMHSFYDHYGSYGGRDTLFKFFDHGYVNGGPGSTGPTSMNHRYVTEDIPYGIVPMADTARLFNVPTPTMDALIRITSIINEEDYMRTGRTLASLGLGDLDGPGLVHYIIGGKK